MGRASIELSGATLRYAEVAPYDAERRLLRLGSCAFEFDVLNALGCAEASKERTTLAEAVGKVFAGGTVQELHVVVPPDRCHTFFVPMPSGLEAPARRKRLEQETDVLLGRRSEEERLHLTADRVRTEAPARGGADVDWVHVVAVPKHLRTRFEAVVEDLPFSAGPWRVTMQGAARAAACKSADSADSETPAEAPYILAVGRYPARTEFALCRGRQWHYSHHTPARTPADSAYFARALLDRLDVDPAAVGRVLVYGPHADVAAGVLSPLRHAIGTPIERLDPMAFVTFNPDNMAAAFDADVYLPCMGVLL